MNIAPAPVSQLAVRLPRWTFERKLALGYGAAALVVVLIVAFCCWQAARFVEFNRRVERSHEVIGAIEEVRERVTEAETNQRGFWLLGDDAIRLDAEAAVNSVTAGLPRLAGLIAEDAVQSAHWHELTAVVREKLARTRQNLKARQRQELPALLESGYVTGEGQRLRVRIHAGLREMIDLEQGRLRGRLARRELSLQIAVGSLVVLGALLGLLLTVIYRIGDAELRGRRGLSRELEVARDEALEAARQKSEFLANMSHELRTPLNGIVGMAGLLREQPLDPGARDCAETIDTCSEALLGIINDVLDFSKLEAGRLRFAHAPFDLRECLDETLGMLAARAADKGLELNATVAGDVPAGLVGDAGRLRQVLLNLLGNAVKFTERGGVVLHVTHRDAHRPGPPAGATGGEGSVALRFEVQDTGIGIAPEGRGRLFQAFSQVDGSNTRRYGGTGLGLAISKELAERMAGEIGVESAPGGGSTFWFTARFDADPARAGVLANSLPPACAALLAGWRVLLAGDPSADRRHVQGILTGWGLFHQSADDGHRALAMLRLAAASARPFHVALLDADLSALNGRALAAEVRADAEVAGTRLILMSDAPAGIPVTLSPELDARLPRPVPARRLLETLQKMARASARSAAADPLPLPAVPPRGSPPGGGPRVLLAEDNPINRKVALRQLHNLGCQVTAAHDGREVLAAVEAAATPFDLILMDVQMPGMDGYETTRRLRARPESAGPRPPIVAMTANAMEGDREKCLAAGMDDYLPKPVKQDALEAVLRRWLPPRASLVADGQPRDRETVSVG